MTVAAANWAEITTGTATETMVQVVAAANHPIRLLEWRISFQGTDNLAAPIKVELVKQTDAGTASALTPVKISRHDGHTLQTTAQSVVTAEPTTTDVLWSMFVHPQGGVIYTVPWPEEFVVPGGERVGLRVVSPAAAVDCVGGITWAE
jgi:hypothetical protein